MTKRTPVDSSSVSISICDLARPLSPVLMVCTPGEIWLVLCARLAAAKMLSKRALGHKDANFRWPQSHFELWASL